jgi:ribosome-associated protein
MPRAKSTVRRGTPRRAGSKHEAAGSAPSKVVRRTRRGVEDDTTRPLALAAVEAARDKKGERPLLLDVRVISSYADYVLLVSAESERQVGAIAEAIEERLAKLGCCVRGIERPGDSGWMLVDLGDLVVHLFFRGAREAYDFEGLWADAPRVPLP